MGRGSIAWCLAAALAACVPKQPGAGGGGGGGPGTGMLPQDQSFTLKDSVDVQGIVFAPEAIGKPAMPKVTTRAKPNLERLRRHVARKNPAAADVQLLVSQLWTDAERLDASNPAGARALREESLAALRKLKASLGARADATTLEMLAPAEVWVGEPAQAITAYEELLQRFATHPGAPAMRTWLAHLYLGQRRLSDAAVLTASWRGQDLSDMAAYVVAWVRAMANDHVGARAAIVAAARTWRDGATRPAVERDLLIMLARGGATLQEATQAINDATGGAVQLRYVLMFKLSEAMKLAGRYVEASKALDVIVNEVVKGQMPADDLVGFRYRQADYAFRLNRPDAAATRAIEAHKALRACAEKCAPATQQAVTERILKLAQFSHTAYAKSLDKRHHDAALALYNYYVALPARPDHETAQGYLRALQDTKASADPNGGKHDEAVMVNVLLARRESLAACYEGVLMREKGLEGTVALSIDVDQQGAVVGASTEPAPGAEGLAAVAGCAVAVAKTWTFPSRTVPGKTIVRAPLQFRIQGAAAQPAPTPAPAPAATPAPAPAPTPPPG